MTKEKIERARYLFSSIGWWAKQQGESKEHILEFAREGYYLLGEVQDPFLQPGPQPGHYDVTKDRIHLGITLAIWGILLTLLLVKCAGWI